MDGGELRRREVAAAIWKGGGELSLCLDLEGGGGGGGEELREEECGCGLGFGLRMDGWMERWRVGRMDGRHVIDPCDN